MQNTLGQEYLCDGFIRESRWLLPAWKPVLATSHKFIKWMTNQKETKGNMLLHNNAFNSMNKLTLPSSYLNCLKVSMETFILFLHSLLLIPHKSKQPLNLGNKHLALHIQMRCIKTNRIIQSWPQGPAVSFAQVIKKRWASPPINLLSTN